MKIQLTYILVSQKMYWDKSPCFIYNLHAVIALMYRLIPLLLESCLKSRACECVFLFDICNFSATYYMHLHFHCAYNSHNYSCIYRGDFAKKLKSKSLPQF
jgi:hypothetical protein